MILPSIKEVTARLRSKKLLATELCERVLKRVSETRELNAFITETPQLARQQAETADIHIRNGSSRLLEGVPIAVKDNFCTENIRTTCGSRMLLKYFPPYTATMVSKLLNHGAVLVGKTNMDEYAMGCGTVDGAFGPVRNCWRYQFGELRDSSRVAASQATHSQHISDSDGVISAAQSEQDDFYIAGGSSGGSAVAVASGCAVAALGSDTGGSTRQPAALCGLVGLKPTYSLLSRHGLVPLVHSLDVPGIMTTNVDDAVTLLNVLAGHDHFDPTTSQSSYSPFELPEICSVNGLHIGIPIEYVTNETSREVLDLWQGVADRLSDAGARVSLVSLPHTQYTIMCYHVLCCCEVASNMACYDGIEYGYRAETEKDASTELIYALSRHHAFNDVVRGRILAGNYFLLKRNYEKFFIKAQKVRRLIADDFNKVFRGGVDLLLAPTTLSDAPKYSVFSKADYQERTEEQDVFTEPVNLAGLPAVTVPVALSQNGLPLGIQLIGQAFKERTMLTVAKAIETTVNFRSLCTKTE